MFISFCCLYPCTCSVHSHWMSCHYYSQPHVIRFSTSSLSAWTLAVTRKVNSSETLYVCVRKHFFLFRGLAQQHQGMYHAHLICWRCAMCCNLSYVPSCALFSLLLMSYISYISYVTLVVCMYTLVVYRYTLSCICNLSLVAPCYTLCSHWLDPVKWLWLHPLEESKADWCFNACSCLEFMLYFRLPHLGYKYARNGWFSLGLYHLPSSVSFILCYSWECVLSSRKNTNIWLHCWRALSSPASFSSCYTKSFLSYQSNAKTWALSSVSSPRKKNCTVGVSTTSEQEERTTAGSVNGC